MYKKTLFFIFSVCISIEASAARMWLQSSIKIDDVLVYNHSGYNIITVKASPESLFETGCAATDTHGIFSFWTQSGLGGTYQSWLSLLLSAQAQELDVNLFVDTSICNTSATWNAFGNPLGLGVPFYGVRIAPE